MHKLVFLMKRRPDFTVAAFHDYWRTRHAPLVAKVSEVRRYVQSHTLPQGYTKGELLFDGIEELWFADDAAFDAARRSPEFAAVMRDGEAFADTSRTAFMAVDVHVIKDGAVPPDAVKNIEFVNRRPGMALEPFRDYWREMHGPIAAKIPVLARYEQNHLKLDAYDGDAEPAYDGLAITWFASTADMKRGAATEEYHVTRADEPNFLPDGHLPIIITREHVIIADRGGSRSVQ